MFKKIWSGLLDGWDKAVDMNHICFAILTVTVTVMGLTGLLATYKFSGLMEWVTENPGRFICSMMPIFIFLAVAISMVAKFSSWWNRNGPGGRRPIHVLWERFKRSRFAVWWLQGMALLMVSAVEHGLLAGTVLLLYLVVLLALTRLFAVGYCGALYLLGILISAMIGTPHFSRFLFRKQIEVSHLSY